MSLRARIESENIQSFEIAASRRYEEGFELLSRGKTLAGIYLMGYSIEMLLKSAFFRYRGRSSGSPITTLTPIRSQLGPARTLGTILIPSVNIENYHSIRFWSLLLVRLRRLKGDPLPVPLDQQFVQRANRIYRNWTETLRYQIIAVSRREEFCFFEDATWIIQNHAKLWR